MSKIHLTRDDIKYTDNPIGKIVPDYLGQICITNDNKVFFANGFTSNDWIEASGGVSKEEFNNLANEVSGAKSFLQDSIIDLINKL